MERSYSSVGRASDFQSGKGGGESESLLRRVCSLGLKCPGLTGEMIFNRLARFENGYVRVCLFVLSVLLAKNQKLTAIANHLSCVRASARPFSLL